MMKLQTPVPNSQKPKVHTLEQTGEMLLTVVFLCTSKITAPVRVVMPTSGSSSVINGCFVMNLQIVFSLKSTRTGTDCVSNALENTSIKN